MAKRDPWLSVVIPAYNEAQRLPPSLGTILQYLQNRDFTWEIVVVDDGSEDGTSEVAREILDGSGPHQILRNDPNRGKALSVVRGLQESRGEVRLFSDADLSTPIHEADRLLEAIRDGADVAIASRQLPGSVIETPQPWHRQLAGQAFGLFNQIVLLPGIPDSQCGFKAFTRQAVTQILPYRRLTGWAFDAELVFIARRLGLQIAQIPVHWRNSPDTKVNMWVDGPKMVFDLLRIRWIHRDLKPEDDRE
ncbi:MAG: dolichyl-phosphate beta-glucosyltransferase [Armatimonadota bacterium]